MDIFSDLLLIGRGLGPGDILGTTVKPRGVCVLDTHVKIRGQLGRVSFSFLPYGASKADGQAWWHWP